jgi:hypothetical protein
MNMVFPAMSTVDPAIRAQAPRTTNAAEASHSHIHHALGSHNDLLEGITKTHLYVKDMERKYNTIMGKFKLSSISSPEKLLNSCSWPLHTIWA